MNEALTDPVHQYHAFGLNIASEVDLPFTVLRPPSKQPDITVQCGHLPHFPGRNDDDTQIQANKEKLLSSIPLFRYYVADGCQVRYPSSFKSRKENDKRALIEVSFMILFMQRGCVMLHGSAVDIHGKAAVFMGDGGSGKSTAAAFLHQQGYDLLGDDTCVITLKDGRPYVVPFCLHQKLNPDSARMLQLNSGRLNREPDEEKFLVQVPQKVTQHPIPLGNIYALQPSDTAQIDLLPLKGIDKIEVLFKNLQIRHLFDKAGLTDELMQNVFTLTQAAHVIRLLRPKTVFKGEKFVASIVNDIQRRNQAPV